VETRALVYDVDLSLVRSGTTDAERDLPRPVSKRVIDDASHRLIESQPVGDHVGWRANHDDRTARRLRSAGEPPPHPFENLRQLDIGQLQRQLTAFGLGDRQKILGELGQAIGLLGR
jgi:hypothetical protein